jgi:Lon protease-like protein
MTQTAPQELPGLPLFPLGTVMLPGMVLPLRIFEARYLDLMSACLRQQQPFGVVTLIRGGEVRGPDAVSTTTQGCLAALLSCDAPSPGLLQVSCLGGARFERQGEPSQDGNGLWRADIRCLAPDPRTTPPEDCADAVAALRQACVNLAAQGQRPFREPLDFEDAAWVANRWCEILPLPPALKIDLMMLTDPVGRLRLVAGFLRRQGIVTTG